MTKSKAALTFNLPVFFVIIFQLTLALGMPWGELTPVSSAIKTFKGITVSIVWACTMVVNGVLFNG